MEEHIWPEWRDHNTQVKYPFTDEATLTNGVDVLAPNLFLDGRLYPVGGGPNQHLQNVRVTGAQVSLIFHDEAGEVARGIIDLTSIVADVPLQDPLGRPAGVMVSTVDVLATLAGLGGGDHLFTVEQTGMAGSVVSATPGRGLQALITPDDETFGGEVWLLGRDGVVLRMEDGAIRVDALGDPFALRKVCAEEGDTLAPLCPIRTINGVPPDENGDFRLTITGEAPGAVDPVLRVDQVGARITLRAVGQRGYGEAGG